MDEEEVKRRIEELYHIVEDNIDDGTKKRFRELHQEFLDRTDQGGEEI